MSPLEIEDFLKLIKNTDIEEMKYKNGDNSLYFKKTDVESVVTKDTTFAKNVSQKIEETKEPAIIAIKSTMVGTFVSSQGNDKLPYVKEGDIITTGQKVGQIEAMKIIKDVLSSVEGKVIKILVSNGQSVEYGQQLFLLEQPKQAK
ncbi:MAG: acetyl-CoA carboxylase biotin carboxyl carrier protein subunit [Endomicrobium sp.]|jgi:acetyl-CoA carboxylase biotin carboxyl carrier protein|uniref:acetyl-CoA carboxylase biotin carboxyl carrier protein n=1 Tax=Candidatus Endomicrobiellum cubanum TaxID=3242325 RepID=UPI00282F26BA|nr:acetyl-CoA carboxylase biotin carboxyl carrier protein subunit [Endomicrobium sp.]